MNISMYLDDKLKRDLDALCAATGRKRNAVVREALEDYLRKQQKPRQNWKEFLDQFPHDPDFPRFEDYRKDLAPLRKAVVA